MNWLLIVVLLVVVDLLVAYGLIAGSLKFLWNPLHLAYPPQTPADDAVRKQRQSFRIGALNLAYCIHVAVDETHLHLTPATLIRWLGGKPTSIPWDAIEFAKRSRFTKSATIQIGKRRVVGPLWCLQLAESDQTSDCPSV